MEGECKGEVAGGEMGEKAGERYPGRGMEEDRREEFGEEWKKAGER